MKNNDNTAFLNFLIISKEKDNVNDIPLPNCKCCRSGTRHRIQFQVPCQLSFMERPFRMKENHNTQKQVAKYKNMFQIHRDNLHVIHQLLQLET